MRKEYFERKERGERKGRKTETEGKLRKSFKG